MFLIFAAFAIPPLLLFGLYHLLIWVNLFNINRRVYWKRVAIASAISHVLLATGFFVFSYVDFHMKSVAAIGVNSFDVYLFDRSEFWRLMTIFDPTPMLALLGVLAVLDRLGINAPILVILAVGLTYIVGTVQWYFVGGGLGLVLERFWSGLKKSDDDEDWL